MPNLFNGSSGQKIALALAAMGQDRDQFGNMLNFFNMQDKQKEADKKENAASSYLLKSDSMKAQTGGTETTGPDGSPIRVGANTQQAPDIGDNLFNSNVTPQTDTSQLELMKAVGSGNMLNARIASMTPKYEKGDDGWYNVNAAGGPKLVTPTGSTLSDFGKDLVASGMTRGSPQFNAAMEEHRKKQDFIPGQTPEEIALRRAQTEEALAKAAESKGKANLLTDIPDGVQGDDVYGLLSPLEAASVKQVVSGAAPMPTSTANPKAMRIRGLVQLADPTYTAARYKTTMDFAPGGKIGTNFVNADAAIQHLAEVADAADHMGNIGTPLVGKAYNYASQGAKDLGSNPAKSSFIQARENAAGEMVKFIRGTSGDATSVAEMRSNLKPTAAPDEINSAIGTGIKLILDRAGAQANAYNAVMPPTMQKAPTDFLSPKSRDIINALEARAAKANGMPALDVSGAGGPAAQAAPAQAAPAAPHVPPGMVRQVGTYQGKPVFVDAQGQRHVAQ